jgi:Alba
MLQVRITAVNKVRNYITYAMLLLEEKGHSAVVLKAMGKAINKSVIVGADCSSDGPVPHSAAKTTHCTLHACTPKSTTHNAHMFMPSLLALQLPTIPAYTCAAPLVLCVRSGDSQASCRGSAPAYQHLFHQHRGRVGAQRGGP